MQYSIALKKSKFSSIVVYTAFFLCMYCMACNTQEYAQQPHQALRFSVDTIFFDTIFSEKGSITRVFKVYNPHKGTIRIDDITVSKSYGYEFFINVNGYNAQKHTNIELPGGDSMFVFVQAKLQENNVDSAIIRTDSICFAYNTNKKSILIQAWGQDVHFMKGQTVGDTTFSGKKPYVIYDSLVIAPGTTLTIEEGVRIFLHLHANIIVKGSLKIQGSMEKKVMISSDRLEPAYQLIPGQWGSIIFAKTSKNNSIDYAIIKNGIHGIYAPYSESGTSIHIANTRIENMSKHAIFAQNASILTYNSLYTHCNDYVFSIQGGEFSAYHCTIYNEGTIGGRTTSSSIFVSDFHSGTNNKIPLLEARFFNSIIIGSMQNEIKISSFEKNSPIACTFDYCLLKQTYTSKDTVYFGKNFFYNSSKPLFKSVYEKNYSLAADSQAANLGDMQYAESYTLDIQKNSRIADSKPDIGAYEYEAKD